MKHTDVSATTAFFFSPPRFPLLPELGTVLRAALPYAPQRRKATFPPKHLLRLQESSSPPSWPPIFPWGRRHSCPPRTTAAWDGIIFPAFVSTSIQALPGRGEALGHDEGLADTWRSQQPASLGGMLMNESERISRADRGR